MAIPKPCAGSQTQAPTTGKRARVEIDAKAKKGGYNPFDLERKVNGGELSVTYEIEGGGLYDQSLVDILS